VVRFGLVAGVMVRSSSTSLPVLSENLPLTALSLMDAEPFVDSILLLLLPLLKVGVVSDRPNKVLIRVRLRGAGPTLSAEWPECEKASLSFWELLLLGS